MSGNQGISRLTRYYQYVSGDCRLSIGDRLICKFDTGGYKTITHTFRNQIWIN